MRLRVSQWQELDHHKHLICGCIWGQWLYSHSKSPSPYSGSQAFSDPAPTPSLISSPHICSLIHSPPVSLSLKLTRPAPASEPSPLTFPVPGMHFLSRLLSPPLTSFRSLLSGHLIRQAFPGWALQNIHVTSLSWYLLCSLLFFSSTAVTTCWHNTHKWMLHHHILNII